MNILLWILQVLLALWNLIGGSYTFSHYAEIRGDWMAGFPTVFWYALALLQILFALGLVVPGMLRRWPRLTFISAVGLACNSLLGCAICAKYVGFPGMLWGVIPALVAAFVAYGRRARKKS
jgi:hypothetical protein